MISRRSAIIAAIAVVSIFTIVKFNSGLLGEQLADTRLSIPLGNAKAEPHKPDPNSPLSPEVLTYFEQVFSVAKPAPYDFPALKEQCDRVTAWQDEDVYLKCGGLAAGLTSIMSELKVCFKMALEAGTGIVLPAMPLRDSKDLGEWNFLNSDAYMTYDRWFDADHLIEAFGRACPRMKIVHPDLLDADTADAVKVKNNWNIDLGEAEGYQGIASSYFWVGRPFRPFFDQQYLKLRQQDFLSADRDDTKTGATVITIGSPFLLFKITDDPTRRELRLWNDLGQIIRFLEVQRKIVHELLNTMKRPFYGVHFRAENDTIWSSPDNQLAVDLDALDLAWSMYGSEGEQKPLVYLACGDQSQVERFAQEGSSRGWDVTHKWALAQDNAEILRMINDLPFDFQGAVDMGIMVKSHFFFGITGSAFSSTIANARDVTGKYRGSSFSVFDDGNARSHLFNDGDAGLYPCCL